MSTQVLHTAATYSPSLTNLMLRLPGDAEASLRNNADVTISNFTVAAPLQETGRQSLLSVFDSLKSLPFHVVCLDDEAALDRSSTNSDALPTEIPENTSAIIILGMLSRKTVIQAFLIELQKHPEASQPIIVVTVDEGVQLEFEEIRRAMVSFLDLGAHELILQRSGGIELETEVYLRVQHAAHAQRQVRFHLAKSRENQERQFFWPIVHTLLPGFPQLQTRWRPIDISSTLLHMIGEGAFGKVYKCMNKTSGDVEALKVIPKAALPHTNLMAIADAICNEITVLQKLEHRNVVKLKCAKHATDHILLFMDLAGQETLYTNMQASDTRRMNFLDAIEYHRQIIAGIGYCHEQGVAHRDLNPNNIMIDRDVAGHRQVVTVRIIDFGCAVKCPHAGTEICGTVPFIPPEVVLRSGFEIYNPTRVDMWACGVIFLEMLCGLGKMQEMLQWDSMPRANMAYGRQLKEFFENRQTVLANIATDGWHSGGNALPEQVKAVLLGMLQPCPLSRWDAMQVQSQNEIL